MTPSSVQGGDFKVEELWHAANKQINVRTAVFFYEEENAPAI